jgi:transposase
MAKIWTEKEEQRLQQMVDQGFLQTEIAEYLGRSLGSISSKVKKMRMLEKYGPKKPRKRRNSWTDEEVAKLIEMFEDGISTKKISEVLGRGWPATRTKLTLLREEGYKIKRRRLNHRQKAQNARKHHGVNIGHISLCLFDDAANVTEDAADWIVQKTAAMGYKSVAEYLIDIALEQYYEETADGR